MILGKNYIEKDMLFIVKSEIRLKILTELNDEPQTIKDIVNKTNIAYSSVSNNMNKLEYKNHVTKENRVYTMTPMTKLYFNQLMEFKKSVDVIKNFDSLWYKHDINNINTELIKNITELYESKLIETDPIDIYKTHNNIRKQLENSKNIRGILPYIHPDYPKLIENIMKNDGKIELIMGKDIYKGLISQIDKDLKNRCIKNSSLKIHILKEKLDIYLLICDESMNLGLFKTDGSYDQNRILNSNTPESVKWANDLFETMKMKVI
ncbi:winged helix-turn-helix domain-containing protein [uncultured Methanobrevibacter sp.]|uniref:helix-turn-helix transcriptional regulator n=2 Tax=uncultured Methanobrevibacter sp. TaxID=253161 RepID=UPI0025E904E8|nr:transcriptional regulator FilR1 domain-containing protein [uncultured Methanobrevibacter sp.]